MKEALNQAGIEGMTISEVKGFGRQKATPKSIAAANTPDFLPKIKIEIAVADGKVAPPPPS